MDPEWFSLTRANLVDIYLPLGATLIVVVSVIVAVMHLREYKRELDLQATAQRNDQSRALAQFEEQVFWSAIAALVHAEADIGRARTSATDDMHRWHSLLKTFVESEMARYAEKGAPRAS